jgi:hypothetical protein
MGTSGMIRLQQQLLPVGVGRHRSGWPAAMQALEAIHADDGIVFDDFVERTFTYGKATEPYNEGWIGVLHTPHDMPHWFDPSQSWPAIKAAALFQQSLRHLKGVICLSREAAGFYRNALNVPAIALTHPTETPEQKFDPDRFLKRTPYIVQIGWWLRNLGAIYQLPAIAGYAKLHLRQNDEWVRRAEWNVQEYWRRTGGRTRHGGVQHCLPLSNEHYDQVFVDNIVFLELFATSANNVIVECMARNTPVVVNRLPALEEYLGPAYPLFYDEWAQAPEMFAKNKVLEAHEYLKGMDKAGLRFDTFVNGVREAVRSIQGSREGPSAASRHWPNGADASDIGA